MKLIFYGVVQGVGFRPAVYRVAKQLSSRGYVLNNGSNVEVHIDGDVDEFIARLMEHLPSLARIDAVEWEETEEDLGPFEIRTSSNGKRRSLIPADSALCETCLKEFDDPEDRRFHYCFINCTDCGARFTVIEDVPFDRDRTSMNDFAMCEECSEEYTSPNARRFHAQTMSCPSCGPKYRLYEKGGTAIESGDPFKTFSKKLEAGQVGVLKGWGGMHVVATFESASRLRRLYRRGDKPYAAMVRDVDTAREYAEISQQEEDLLTSPQRPIMLLDKNPEMMDLLEGISPGLHNIGLMLPYSAAHHLLFRNLTVDGVIMTSANPPGEPMITDNIKAFELKLDSYLLHNRKIVNRCDDSVVRINCDRRAFIRRSRGFVPSPIPIDHGKTVISVGAQWDVTGALSRNGELFLSQYIGETDKYPTLQFLESAIRHMMRLLGVDEVDAVAADRHPKYSTKIVARSLSADFDCDLVEVNHYHSHAASLMTDHGISDPGIFLTWDGTGYGDDGTSWGGETLMADCGKYQRLASLRKLPLLGGDRAVVDVRRIVAAIKLMLNREVSEFSDDDTEIFSKMLPRSPRTSSMGRVLDALSCILGVSCRRSYEGEPAIKLERLLSEGTPSEIFDVRVDQTNGLKSIDTLHMFDQLLGMTWNSEQERANVARSFVEALVKEPARIACDLAESKGLSYIGFSGGVAYNNIICEILREQVESRGVVFITHDQIPPGDGGISAGQNAIVGARLTGKH